MVDLTQLESAVLAAVDKVGKPSWRSPTWWACTVAPIFLPVILLVVGIAPASPVALVTGAAVMSIAAVVGHLKDGWLKTALAAAQPLWQLVHAIISARGDELAKLSKLPYSSLNNPAKVASATPGGADQEPDEDEPTGGKGDAR